jgi:hypothetical protein
MTGSDLTGSNEIKSVFFILYIPSVIFAVNISETYREEIIFAEL